MIPDNKKQGFNTDSAKGQKIVAAIYLVTAHLSDMDPLRLRLREEAIALLDVSADERNAIAKHLGALLTTATYAKLISDHNAALIASELGYFSVATLDDDELMLATLFQPPAFDKGQFPIKKTYSDLSLISNNRTAVNNHKNNMENKTNRQKTIMSFIDDRKSASIKDISALFPGLSEKTIQRELGLLVSLGKITKRGNKRWSIYLAVGN